MEFRFALNTATEAQRVTDADLNELEQTYGFTFPSVLREYYLKHNGDEILTSYLVLDDIRYCVVHFPPLNQGIASLKAILERNRKYHDEPEYLIRLADDRGNGVFLWDTRDEHVYFREVDDEDEYTFICAGVERFFEILNSAYWRESDPGYDITEMTRSDKEMANVEFLPLGSIVLLKGGIRKLMIIGRGLNVKKDDDTYFFDYGGILYPDGVTGDEMLYFNADGISKVYFHGYQDDDNDIVLENLNNYLLEHPDVKRADPEKWNA